MDILTHICSGIAVAGGVAVFAGKSWKVNTGIMTAGALGGAFPDIDAISMWSKFDTTFGKLFGLSHKGTVIYGAKFWYSHHAFFHSLAAGVIVGLLFAGIIAGLCRMRKKTIGISSLAFFFIPFVSGYWIHLLEDLPTPASVWGGVNMFWPASSYVGGFGKIWWWNNYDIFLIVCACIVLLILVLLSRKYSGSIMKPIAGAMLVLAFVLVTIQINNRKYDYAYTGHADKYYEMEQESKKEQERVLGRKAYRKMEQFDRLIPFNF